MRTLDSAKLDIHALADVVEARRSADQRYAEPSWHEIACECAAHPRSLRENERDFVDDMVRWIRARGEPTEKQAKWLRSIYVRVATQVTNEKPKTYNGDLGAPAGRAAAADRAAALGGVAVGIARHQNGEEVDQAAAQARDPGHNARSNDPDTGAPMTMPSPL